MEYYNFSTNNIFLKTKEGNSIGRTDEARLRGTYITGINSHEKENFIAQLAIRDINSGKSVVFLDPDGFLSDELINKIDKKRTDIHVVDPSNLAIPFALNPFELTQAEPKKRETYKNKS